MMSDSVKSSVMVVSHERSGTHFMMNSLATCFGYDVTPWLNLDFPQTAADMFCPSDVSYYQQDSVTPFFANIEDEHRNKIVKSHHPIDFFLGGLRDIFNADYKIIYMYRNPLDVMLSQHSMVRQLNRFEGPKTNTVSEFIRSEPAGWMMRYQYYQKANMLKRWEDHVVDWLDYKGRDVLHIAYEDLNKNYTQMMKRAGEFLNNTKGNYVRPDRDKNVSNGLGYYDRDDYDASDLAFFERTIGDTMRRLDYTITDN